MTWQLAAYCRTADLYANRSECRYSAKLMLIVTYGPKLPFTHTLDAATQLPGSGHWNRCAAF